MQVHLVDGTYELFRAYFGAPKAHAPDGREVGATRGLARSLLGLLRNEGATHVAVAFDHVIESFRNELFAGYKTGAGIAPDLWSQFEFAEQIGDTADGIPGIPRWGARSASAMLAEYGYIDHIPGDSAQWSIKLRGAVALADSLNTHLKEGALYRQLATLRTDVPLQESLDSLEWQGAVRKELEKLCQILGDPRLLDRIPSNSEVLNHN